MSLRDNVVESLEYKDHKINIYYDTDPMNPREDDNFGTMACFHQRYNLGDKHNYSIEEIEEMIKTGKVLALSLYLYDHGGITMSTNGFNCPWDSGQVGYIFIEKEKIKKEFGHKRITKKVKEKILKYLEGEVECYDNFLTGQIFGYVITSNETGEDTDSCWGFDDQKYMIEDCKQMIDYYDNQKRTSLHFEI